MLSLVTAVITPVISISMIADARDVAATVSRFSGISVTFAKDVGRQTLTVEVKSKPIGDILSHLAYATFTRIERVGTGYVLKKDPAEIARSLSDYRAFLDQSTQKVQAELYEKYVQKPFTFEENTSYEEALKATEPASTGDLIQKQEIIKQMPRPITRALATLLHDIPIEKWRRPGHAMVVFSDQPVGSESRLSASSLKSMLAAYHRDVSIAKKPNITGIVRILLVFRRTDKQDDPTSELMLLDEDDNALDSAILPLSAQSRRWGPPAGLLDSIPDSVPVPYSAITNAFVPSPRLTVKQKHDWQDPTKFDPQYIVQGDIWRGLARQTNRSLIMRLPDDWIGMYPMPFKARPQNGPPGLKESVQICWRRPIRVDPTWISYRPADANLIIAGQYDRVALRDGIRAAIRNDGTVLAAKGKLCYASKFDTMPGQLFWYLNALGAKPLMVMGTRDDAGLLALIGSLTDVQRNKWLGGDSVKVSEISSESKFWLTRWLEQAIIEPANYLRSSSANRLFSEASPKGIEGAILCTPKLSMKYGVVLASGFMCRPSAMF